LVEESCLDRSQVEHALVVGVGEHIVVVSLEACVHAVLALGSPKQFKGLVRQQLNRQVVLEVNLLGQPLLALKHRQLVEEARIGVTLVPTFALFQNEYV
jgi:hypothetical protein